MGIFSLTQELAMDLGTANTLIIIGDKVVVDEPSIVAVDNITKKVMAVGAEAQLMHCKTHEGVRTIRPLRGGVIADFAAAEQMIKGMIKKIPSKSWFTPSIRMVVCIPSSSTEVEIRAVRDSAEHSGGREVRMIYEPMAAALGSGINVEEPSGNMIVDIGGGTSEVAVISLGGIAATDYTKTAGDVFTNDIINYMLDQYQMKIGERTAEEIKIKVGSVLPDLPEDEAPEPMMVHAPSVINAMPIHTPITYSEIAHALDHSITQIEAMIIRTLQRTSPELYADIVNKGIYLAGGGALLRGLARRLESKVQIPFRVAEDPLRAIVRGTGLALKKWKQQNKVPYLIE